MFHNMSSFPKDHTEAPVPPTVRRIARASMVTSLVLVATFLIEFELFRFGKISALTFGMAISGTIAIYTVVSQLLRQAARKRGSELTIDEKASVNSRTLKNLRQQKQLNTVLVCMFCLGAAAVVTNVFLNHQSPALLSVPAALLSFGIWYRRTLNRAIETLEQRIRIDTLRG